MKNKFNGIGFDDLCKMYLKEGADISALATEDEVTEMREMDSEFDAEMESEDSFGEDETESGVGDKTITLSMEEISVLRAIL